MRVSTKLLCQTDSPTKLKGEFDLLGRSTVNSTQREGRRSDDQHFILL